MGSTNQNMIEGLERMYNLLGRLKVANMEELVDTIEELTAWSPVLKTHISAQKRLNNSMFGDKYAYDATTGKVSRVYEEKSE